MIGWRVESARTAVQIVRKKGLDVFETCYMNGSWCAPEDARVHLFDSGLMYGDMLTETLRTFRGRLFEPDAHLWRFERSMRAARVELPVKFNVGELVAECAGRAYESYRQDVLVKLDATRGVFDYYRDPSQSYENAHLYLHGIRIPFWKFSEKYTSGIAVAYPLVRQGSAQSLDLRIKHRSRIYQAIAEREARDVDAEAQALLLDGDGYIAEGTGSNVFIVAQGIVVTPTTENCLEGVSRGFVISLCRKLGIPVREERIRPYDLLMADEAFATATSYCLLPIVRAQGRPAGGGECGPVTRRIREAWIEAVGVDFVEEAKAESTPRGVIARGEPAGTVTGAPARVG